MALSPSRISDRALTRLDAGIALALAMAAAVVRCLNWSRIFVDGEVRFPGLDAYYHMRRIMSTIEHWPQVPHFDYYINFPDWTKVVFWGPALDWLLATMALILGLGSPSEADVERWCALAVPALGALSVVCGYLLARELVGRGAAVIAAAIIVILPLHAHWGLLGRVDHHVTEPLFASLLWLFYLRARRTGQRRDAYLAGLAQALAVLVWPGAILFSGLLLATLLAECALAAHARRPEHVALTAGVRTLLSGAVLTALLTPFSPWGRAGDIEYVSVSWFQPIALSGFAATLWLARWLGERVRGGLPLLRAGALPLAGLALLGVAALMVPALRKNILAGFGYLLTVDRVTRTISESLSPLVGIDFPHFSWLFTYWSLLLPFAMLWIGLSRATWREDERGFQRRFILVLVLLGSGLALLQFRHFAAFSLLMPIAVAAALEDWGRIVARPRARGAVAVTIFLAFSAQHLWIYTAARARLLRDPEVTPYLEPLTWMRHNTPPTSEGIQPDDAPAYGVMGHFGIGMFLNYVARRPSVGFPAVQWPLYEEAIRETFRFAFAETEEEAYGILSRRRVRYVITIPFYTYAKKGAAILGIDPERWLVDSRRFEGEFNPSRFEFQLPYFRLVRSRLLLFDGSEYTLRGESIPALQHFRLVFQSTLLHNPMLFGEWRSELPRDLRFCKIYEVVPGARITGHAAPLADIRLDIDLRVDGAPRFSYRSSARADRSGRYSFTVPYSTEPSEGVTAVGPYRIQTGQEETRLVHVSEEAVMTGLEVSADAPGAP
jgi:dolichyl-diphosphooligosaccharide--protein glycosyltransferase